MSNTKTLQETLASTLTTLKTRLPANLAAPTVGIVCGSGLSTLADSLREVVRVKYEELEGFGKSTGASRLRVLIDLEIDNGWMDSRGT